MGTPWVGLSGAGGADACFDVEPVFQHFLFPFGGVLWLAVAVGANGVIRRNFLFCMRWAWRRWAGLMGFQAAFLGQAA